MRFYGTTPLAMMCSQLPFRRTVSTSPPAPLTTESIYSTRTAARRYGATIPRIIGCARSLSRLTASTSPPAPITTRSTYSPRAAVPRSGATKPGVRCSRWPSLRMGSMLSQAQKGTWFIFLTRIVALRFGLTPQWAMFSQLIFRPVANIFLLVWGLLVRRLSSLEKIAIHPFGIMLQGT